MRKLKIIISGGGTGGHIFPAIAIADSIRNRVENAEILFVGAKDRMEMQKVPEAGYNIKGLWISGFQRRLSIKNLFFPLKLIVSLFSSQRIIQEFDPDLVIGTGGFASGPLLYIASKKNIPSLIQEQNSYPGITNKILGKHVDKICVAYDKMERFFPISKLTLTGNPIRQEILDFNNKKNKGREMFGVNNNQITILVIGGSLGARTINESIADNLIKFKENNLNLIWQTGVSYKDKSKSLTKEINVEGISSHIFIREMDKAYAAADIIVSRAGAIAISELCCVGKPVILVPSPNVAEDHQTKNAQSLVNKNCAMMVKDIDANRKLVDKLISLSSDVKKREELSINIKNLSIIDSAEKIANLSLELIK